MSGRGKVDRAIAAIGDPMVVMRRVVDEALLLIPSAEGSVVELATDGILTYACAAGTLSPHVGLRLDSAGSFSGLAVRSGTTLICNDSSADFRVDADACQRVGAVSMICVPLLRGGDPVGVLKVSASYAHAFSQDDVSALARLAEFISWAIATATDLAECLSGLQADPLPNGGSVSNERHHNDQASAQAAFVGNVLRPGIVSDSRIWDRIEAVIAGSSMRIVCQPIVDLRTGCLAGAEALARFPGPDPTPESWFADAQRVGLGTQLELAALTQAFELLGDIPSAAYLAVNASPQAVLAAESSGILDTCDPNRIVIELTEHLEVESYPRLSATLIRLRRRGFRIAIDDTGAGFSTFAHILKLAPDIIKLDRILTTGIDLDPVRRALAGALTTFAHESGAQIVAEGIETRGELDTVIDLGIIFGQGYHLGHPTTVAQLHHYQLAPNTTR